MFERFTEGAIKVIMVAQEESRKMGHNFVGTEQLLLGVSGQKYGIGARALKRMKITNRKLRKEIEQYIGMGTGFVGTEIPFTPRAKRVLEMAVQEGIDLEQNFVGTEHLLLSLISEPDGVARRTLETLNVDFRRLRETVINLIEEAQETMMRALSKAEQFILDRERYGGYTPTLDEYCENVTQDVLDGSIDPIVGREKEIEDVIAVLARRRKNNPVLIGEPGVGKTAVAEGLAQLILTEKGPEFLDGHIILSLDLGSALAGTKYRGEFEDRLKRMVQELEYTPAIILVIDEIHTLVGAGAAEGAVDAANILKPALARGRIRCVGATTKEEYRKYIERDAALERRFQPVLVEEPDVGTTIEILRGLRSKFEQHHGLSYSDKAIEQAATLAKKYIADRYLPDKAIDVLDEAGARVRLENKRLPSGIKALLDELQVTILEKEEAMKDHDFDAARQLLDHEMEVRSHIAIMKNALQERLTYGRYRSMRQEMDIVVENDIAKVISNWTGIPITTLSVSESERLLNMESTLHERIIGQKHAVTAVSKAIRRARAGLRNPNRPIASFIFAGPTGVGKTELTKTLAEYMFPHSDSLLRLDMSEYMEKHTVAKLIGSPPGYIGYNEGGQLTESVRTTPYCVVLFDEVEKAHPDVFNLLLQILDDGRLTDSQGRFIDFTNTLIIMTTNLGARIIESESGIKAKSELSEEETTVPNRPDVYRGWAPAPEPERDNEIFERVTKLVNEELKTFFRPEFLNRVDEIVVFTHLTKTDIWEICAIMISQVTTRLSEKGVKLEVDPSVRCLLSYEGYDPVYGARPLRRAVMRYLEDILAEECLSTTLYPNTKIKVTRKTMEDCSIFYTNQLEVTVDSSEVDPSCFTDQEKRTDGKLDKDSDSSPRDVEDVRQRLLDQDQRNRPNKPKPW